MRRRTLLATAGGAVATGVAGCLGDVGEDQPTATGTPTASPTAGSSPTGTATPSSSPGTPTTSFEVTNRACGSGEDVTTVTFAEGAVEIEGTIEGANACVDARLADARFENGRLLVFVETVRPDDAEGCAQCITDIDYRARLGFEGEPPGSVVVNHDGETVSRTQA